MDEKILEQASKMKLFSGVDSEVLNIIVENSEVHRLRDGDVIFEQGDEADGNIYLILSGTLAVVKEMRQGPRDVNVLKQDSYFGELAVFTGEPRQASVEARENSSVLAVNYSTINSLKKSHPEAVAQIFENMFKQVANQLRAMAEKAEKTQFWFK